MTRYQKLLLRVRAYIDRQVPRDVLIVSVIDGGKVVFREDHLTLLGHLKQDTLGNVGFQSDNAVRVNFHTEFLP